MTKDPIGDAAREAMAKEEVTWIETFTGKRVNPMHLDEELIDIVDIAHSLALQCRFIGHCLTFYSIAEHSILVADTVRKELTPWVKELTPWVDNTCLAALLHDAAEAYLGDIARPIKHHPMFKQVIELEKQILGKVMVKFGCTGADWQLIKKADNIMLATEAKYLMADSGRGWYLPEPALADMSILPASECIEDVFLGKFELYGGKY